MDLGQTSHSTVNKPQANIEPPEITTLDSEIDSQCDIQNQPKITEESSTNLKLFIETLLDGLSEIEGKRFELKK
jgi:hypothetical protein